MRKIVTVLFLCLAHTTFAFDGTTTGKIERIDVLRNGENLGFRVIMEEPISCGTQVSYAHLNKSEDNYETMVSALMAAHFANREITLFTNVDPDGVHCRIEYLRVF